MALAGLSTQGCSSDPGESADELAGAGSGGSIAVGGNPGVSLGGAPSSGAGGTAGADGLCGGDRVDAEPVDVNLLFVIDRSESMEGTPEGFSSPKWETLVAALKESLAGIRGKMAVGLQFFPDPAEGAADAHCGMPTDGSLSVPIGESELTVPVIEQKLDQSLPTGSTPTADALALAREYFASEGADLEGKKYVLLALDGGPNCNDTLSCGEDTPAARALCTQSYDKPMACGEMAPFNCCNEQPKGCLDATRVVNEVEQLRDAGIITLVVGIPGSEPYADVLDALAEAGGAKASDDSPKYFKVEDPDALTRALSDLSLNLIKSCELQLETEPPDVLKINVYLDDLVVPQSGEDGWELDSSSAPSTIRLKGATCAELETNGAGSIRVEFGCPTIYVPR